MRTWDASAMPCPTEWGGRSRREVGRLRGSCSAEARQPPRTCRKSARSRAQANDRNAWVASCASVCHGLMRKARRVPGSEARAHRAGVYSRLPNMADLVETRNLHARTPAWRRCVRAGASDASRSSKHRTCDQCVALPLRRSRGQQGKSPSNPPRSVNAQHCSGGCLALTL